MSAGLKGHGNIQLNKARIKIHIVLFKEKKFCESYYKGHLHLHAMTVITEKVWGFNFGNGGGDGINRRQARFVNCLEPLDLC